MLVRVPKRAPELLNASAPSTKMPARVPKCAPEYQNARPGSKMPAHVLKHVPERLNARALAQTRAERQNAHAHVPKCAPECQNARARPNVRPGSKMPAHVLKCVPECLNARAHAPQACRAPKCPLAWPNARPRGQMCVERQNARARAQMHAERAPKYSCTQ